LFFMALLLMSLFFHYFMAISLLYLPKIGFLIRDGITGVI
jgi:hypothetical protein